MKVRFNTRIFEEKDLEAVRHINRVCLPENYDNSFFLNIHKNFPLTFLVATIDEIVVGYIMCRIELGFSDIKRFKIGRRGHVISLAVLPKYRRQGIAHTLLSEALRNVSKYGVGECYLEVRVSNEPAIGLYRELDFKTIRTIAGYYRDGEDAYVMSKLVI